MRACGGIVTVVSAPPSIFLSTIELMPVPGRPDARCGPFVFGLMRAPASRYIGCDSSAIVGYARALISAICCLLGLTEICAGGSASKTSMMC